MTSFQETYRLFGPLNRPDFKTNVRHRAVLRKALELFPAEELQAIFGRPIRLRVAMGSASTFSQLGKIKTNYRHCGLTHPQMHNRRLVTQETPAPDADARHALQAYRDAYDTYFMAQGNGYSIRDAQAKSVLQTAEQTWHDWVVPYLAARGRPGRPDWALQPLPGLQRVRPTPAPAPAPRAVMAAQPARRRYVHLPTPPPSSPVRPSSPAPARFGSRLRPIHIFDNEEVLRPPRRKFLGTVDVSDDEEEALPLRKKLKFLGVVNLTN
ncbi:hypothetical protein B0H17DRAFT_1151546 [Mycena rosella]|uniref:Uncharacterized protein n=1 Tax=Mycena rosella TaxID=1033263 RepID=A0AAD7FIS9_MYCRO|nr:hypothetical protein B0H17DRAFT_1151546 [Mycena rosella]